jgi:glycine/D-amino acid oxidase-like deaminating enzyme
MIVTEPMSADVWSSVGWAGRETLGDLAHGFFYAQRTADDRIAIGGRAVPYRYASRIDDDGAVANNTIAYLTRVLNAALPQTRGVPIAHGWCGVLGVTRDWSAGVSWDPVTGLGEAGGYVGHGVTATNLAGRTLTDLVLGHQSALTQLPWVGHRSRRWEPEPARWAGINAGLRLAHAADREEARTGRPARIATLLATLTGH